MGIKKEVLITLCLFLVATVILVNFNSTSTSTSPKTKVCVDPAEKTVYPYDTFTININVTNVRALQAYRIIIDYHTSPLDAVSVEFPPGHFLEPLESEVLRITQMKIDDNYNATHGRVYVSVALFSPPTRRCMLQVYRWHARRSGSGILFTITFNCVGRETSVLNLCQTNLSGEDSSISHSRIHGLISTHR